MILERKFEDKSEQKLGNLIDKPPKILLTIARKNYWFKIIFIEKICEKGFKHKFWQITWKTRANLFFSPKFLQAQISNKLSTIMNVIDMLNGIIGEEDEKSKKHEKTPKKGSKKSRHKSKSPKSNNSSPERLKTEVLLSIKNKQKNREAAGEEKWVSNLKIKVGFNMILNFNSQAKSELHLLWSGAALVPDLQLIPKDGQRLLGSLAFKGTRG